MIALLAAANQRRYPGRLTGPFFGLFGSVGGVVVRHGHAPSPGIYSRELASADLSLSLGPKCVSLSLTADISKPSHFAEARERDAEGQAFRHLTHGKVSEDVYEQEVGLIHTRRRWLAEQRAGLEARLTDLERYAVSAESVEALRARMDDRLAGATPQDRRFVLEAIGARVLAPGDGS